MSVKQLHLIIGKKLEMNLRKCYTRKDTGMFWYDPQGLHPITPIVRLIESRYVGQV